MTLIVALAVTSLLMYRRMSDAERELVKLRNETGYLKIEDETLFQAIAIPCEEPLTWKWRAYLPKGSNYWWHLNSGMIPADGVSGSGVSSSEMRPRTQGMEEIITVSIRKDPEPKNKRWLFNVTRRSADGSVQKRAQAPLPFPIRSWTSSSQAQMTEWRVLCGSSKPETRRRGESIILVKTSKSASQHPPVLWTAFCSKPQPGFAVWLEEGP